jgi:hypothetical protein
LTFNAGGTTCSGTVTGTYCVNNDGTGTANGTFAPNPTAPFGFPTANYACPSQTTGAQDATFTIVDPNRVDFVSTDSDTVVSGVALRQNQGNGKGGGDND